MLGGCTDDGFIDFRNWLIAQGKDIYLAFLPLVAVSLARCTSGLVRFQVSLWC